MNQPDLFGAPAAQPVYVVPYAIAVTRTLRELTGAEAWPWDADMKAARMERTVPKLLAVLPAEEAESWRDLFANETRRLDAT